MLEWGEVNQMATDTWADNSGYLYLNEEAKEIMKLLRYNGMVHTDDDIPYITWDRFDRMGDGTREWFYLKCQRLAEIKETV